MASTSSSSIAATPGGAGGAGGVGGHEYASKRTRKSVMGKEDLIPSYWNGENFICVHSPSFDKSKSLPPPSSLSSPSSSSLLSAEQFLESTYHQMSLLQVLVRHLNRTGTLQVNEIKQRFPGYEQEIIQLANILCSIHSLQYYLPPNAKDCNEGVYIISDRLEGDSCEVIPKDVSEREKEELLATRKRLDILEKTSIM